MHPIAQISTAGVINSGLPRNDSGAIYIKDPASTSSSVKF